MNARVLLESCMLAMQPFASYPFHRNPVKSQVLIGKVQACKDAATSMQATM
jgi:hypothetical protein